jgi:1-acyl-sn-glycerol-3-phosphate acyltransferase
MPALIAAVLSAALFGVMHGQIIWMGYGFVVGLLFIAAFLKYRSLIAPILLHISFNASSFLLQALSPGETYSTILFILSAALTLALAVFIAIVRTEPLRGSMEGKERSDRKSFKRKTNTRRLFTRGASMKHLKAHRFIYSVLRPLVKIFLRFRFNMEWAAAERQKGPYILLANHNTDYDPLLVAAGLHEHMYFVASDHILRWKFAGKLLKIFFAPIARLKASTEARTVMDVINAVRDGANVCIFAEGIRSFNGETGEILSSTGKLVKRSGASLITYRIEGGYFTTPLWGHGIRRGRMRGYVKNIYGPEQLAKMSPDEVNRAIRDDLYVDEFALQRKDPVRYRGKNIAEHLEYALYACPACRRIGRMKSSGDVFGCECGFSVRYSEYGFFEGADGSIPPFENVLDWDRWQDSYMEEFIESIRAKPSSEPLFSDGGQSLFRFDRCGENKFEESGKLTMYRDRMELSGTSFALTGITNMTIHGGKVLIFSTLDGSHYEIKNEEPRSARKYLLAYRLLTNS